MTAEPREELHRLVEEIVMAPGWREALRAAVAAADRENAELRGEVERLRSVMHDWAGDMGSAAGRIELLDAERDDLRAQLAAAQAQLAEARRECGHQRAMRQAIRDEFQRYILGALVVRDHLMAARRALIGTGYFTEDEVGPDIAPRILELHAALSAAPQPEPEVAPYETLEEAAANNAIPAEPISPEFRQRLIAAVERPLRVRRAILLLAGHASGHLPGFDRGCRVCRRDWPCEDTQRAAAPALEAFADVTPEPPASDEPTGRSD